MHMSGAKVRLADVAGRQWGRVTRGQLRALADDSRIQRWLRQGYIHRILPTVYAVGHRAPDPIADLAAALLYAGPGAALSHATAAWWLDLVDEKPRKIHVSTPRRCRSLPGIEVHERRRFERISHNGLPAVPLPQTLLDLASTASDRILRRALAKADYRGVLDVPALECALGKGRPGSASLRAALQHHQPQLAHTRSGLEVIFFELCESAGLPLPEVNVRVAGWEVDALWRAERVVVELDGYDNHRSPAQVRRDRRKDLALRAAGLVPLRYTEEQVAGQPAAVTADLTAALIRPAPSA